MPVPPVSAPSAAGLLFESWACIAGDSNVLDVSPTTSLDASAPATAAWFAHSPATPTRATFDGVAGELELAGEQARIPRTVTTVRNTKLITIPAPRARSMRSHRQTAPDP